MTGTDKVITVIGPGAMGAAIAGALLVKGFNVTVWNRTTGITPTDGPAWENLWACQ